MTEISHEDILARLRAKGWMVGVHNDYRLDKKTYTFWLFTKENVCIKGEAETDAEALVICTNQIDKYEKSLIIAPPEDIASIAERIEAWEDEDGPRALDELMELTINIRVQLASAVLARDALEHTCTQQREQIQRNLQFAALAAENLDRLEMQICGCVAAAEGRRNEAKETDYAWSPAHAKIIALWHEKEGLRIKLAAIEQKTSR